MRRVATPVRHTSAGQNYVGQQQEQFCSCHRRLDWWPAVQVNLPQQHLLPSMWVKQRAHQLHSGNVLYLKDVISCCSTCAWVIRLCHHCCSSLVGVGQQVVRQLTGHMMANVVGYLAVAAFPAVAAVPAWPPLYLQLMLCPAAAVELHLNRVCRLLSTDTIRQLLPALDRRFYQLLVMDSWRHQAHSQHCSIVGPTDHQSRPG